MPPRRDDWCVTHMTWDGHEADLTVWSGFPVPGTGKGPVDVFTSYVRPGEEPKELHHLSKFWLPLETPRHYESQKALAAVQGDDDLYFAGDYTNDIGSHEDAIVSAVRVADALVPDGKRLAAIHQERGAPIAL
jgi:predicted NAD/FAD-binding protein